MELLNMNLKQTKSYLFVRFEYLAQYGDPADELYPIDTYPGYTITDIKKCLYNKFIFGNLKEKQYELYLHDKLLENDKTIVDIKRGELLYVKCKLRLILDIVGHGFHTIYLYTTDTVENIKHFIINFLKIKINEDINNHQIKAFYNKIELEEDEQLSIYNIYNYSTISIDIKL